MAWNDGLDTNSPAYKLASTNARTMRAVAGPGSGKSFAIQRRIARALEEGSAPDRILAITFTRASARDLRNEINSLNVEGAEQVHARTLHSHALRILSQDGVLAQTGRTPRMVIEHEIAPALRDIDNPDFGGIERKEILLKQYLSAWASLQSDDPGFAKNENQQNFENELLAWLNYHKGVLIGEVIPIVINYLRNNPASPEIGKYSLILVDEYQDLNKSEQEFIRLIRGNAEIIIVGDDDQSIYSFKSAHPEGIQKIEELHGAYDDVAFDECRRCPTRVTSMASTLISRNPNRTLGPLLPRASNPQGIVQIIQWDDYEQELAGIARLVIDELKLGVIRPEDVLILAPRRRIGYRLRDKFLAVGLPAKSYFREVAIKNDAVRRAFSLFSLLANTNDQLSLRYLLGFDSADYRKNQYEKLREMSAEKGISIYGTLIAILNGQLPETGLKTILAEFRKILIDLTSIKKEITAGPEGAFQKLFIHNEDAEIEFYEFKQLYSIAINEVGFIGQIPDDEFDDWFKKVFTSLLENVALPEVPDVVDHIRIMSLHSSKGLKGKFVIVCSMIDQLIPNKKGVDTDAKRVFAEQEGRRLFYVAITRCLSSDNYEGRLIISSFRQIHGLEAVKMGLSANPKAVLQVMATRYLQNFGNTAPAPIKGDTLFDG